MPTFLSLREGNALAIMDWLTSPMIPFMIIIAVPKDTYYGQHSAWKAREAGTLSSRCGYLQCLPGEGSLY